MEARSTAYKRKNDQVGILLERKAWKVLVKYAKQQGMLRSRALTTLVTWGAYSLAKDNRELKKARNAKVTA
jgi:hypothetical protein